MSIKSWFQRVVLTGPTGADASPSNPVPVEVLGSQASAFGEAVITPAQPVLTAYLSSFADTRVWTTYTSGSGTIAFPSGSSSIVDLACSATSGSYAAMQTVDVAPYVPGQGMCPRWTARFDSPAANTATYAGPYHAEDGFYVGYNGTTFVFGHRHGRKLEIQRLEITAIPTGAENFTITLGGNANAVNGISGASTAATAAAIARSGVTFSDGTYTWLPYQVDSYVYFIRQFHGDATGTMSFASAGTATGTFTETQAGADGSADEVALANWDDPLDGTGASGLTLDPSKLNVYQVTYGFLGAAPPKLYVQDQNTGRMVLVHTIAWANVETLPSLEDPRLPMAYAAYNTGGSNTTKVSGASCAIIAQGNADYSGPTWSKYTSEAAVGTTETPLLTLQTATVDQARGRVNRRRVIVQGIVVSNAGAKDAVVRLYLGSPSNLTGYVFEQDNDNLSSALWTDETATAVTAGLPTALTIGIPAGQAVHIPAPEGKFVLPRGRCLIATAFTRSSTTELVMSYYGREDG